MRPSSIDNSVYISDDLLQYVHVDDEILSGDDNTVRTMIQSLQERSLVKKVDYVAREGDSGTILGRTILRTKHGYRIITSSKYVDQSLRDMDMESCNPVTTPSLNVTEKDWNDAVQLPDSLAAIYRRATGSLLYVAGQRPDAQQAMKESARGMQHPTNVHWARLKRVLRYLVTRRVAEWSFEPTRERACCEEITATCDSDWGGCTPTRRSTMGIVLRFAGSAIATMRRTQGGVSLNSGEAEYYAMVSALAEAKQIQEILGECGLQTHIVLETDSSAAKACAERPGSGRMKHINVKYRYLQEAVANQEVKVR